MSKINRPLAFTVAAVVIGASAALWSTTGALGQATGIPSNKNGDWTHYTPTSGARSTRRSTR